MTHILTKDMLRGSKRRFERISSKLKHNQRSLYVVHINRETKTYYAIEDGTREKKVFRDLVGVNEFIKNLLRIGYLEIKPISESEMEMAMLQKSLNEAALSLAAASRATTQVLEYLNKMGASSKTPPDENLSL